MQLEWLRPEATWLPLPLLMPGEGRKITIIGREEVGDGLVAVIINGDVGAVKAPPKQALKSRARLERWFRFM